MRTLLLSTGFAVAMGAFAMGSANAAPISTRVVVAAPAAITDVACRQVKKVVFKNGVKRVTTFQECSRPVVRERVVVGPRRRAPVVGIGVNIR